MDRSRTTPRSKRNRQEPRRGDYETVGLGVDELVLGHRALVRGRLGLGDALLAALLPLLREPLLTDERQDAVGFLGEVDRGEARQDRDEVHGREQRVHTVAERDAEPAEDVGQEIGRDPVEDRGARGERESTE